jgi:transcriptional regulator with XRE-family HTH domain
MHEDDRRPAIPLYAYSQAAAVDLDHLHESEHLPIGVTSHELCVGYLRYAHVHERVIVATASNRARVGQELRRIREDAGLSGERVAAALGWSQSKLSRIETARFSVTIWDLAHLLDHYGVVEEERAELMTAIADDSDMGGAWIVRAGGPPRRQREVAAVESRVTRLRQYHPIAVPGQLQSASYAREVARASGLTKPERISTLRMERQRLLSEGDPPDYHVVVDERCLWRWPGHKALMQEQIDHMVARAELPSICLQVLPTGGEALALALSPFLIYDFRAEGSPTTVLIETHTTDLYLSAPKDVHGYDSLFEMLADEALSPSESMIYLKTVRRRVARTR